jgi:hypothetical protein
MSHAKTSAGLCAITLLASFTTFAQTPSAIAAPPAEPLTLSGLHLTCNDFKHNQDGSCSPLHPIQIGPIRMNRDFSIREGANFGGIDLAATLNKECT